MHINEHWTIHTEYLLKKAKSSTDEIKFAWNGQVCIRKTSQTPAQKIDSIEQLEDLMNDRESEDEEGETESKITTKSTKTRENSKPKQTSLDEYGYTASNPL